MKSKLSIILVTVLLLALGGYSQDDSMRTRNDKPGTPQSLRTADQSPQSHVNVINANTAPDQSGTHATTGNNEINNTLIADPNTADKPAPTSPITLVNKPRRDSGVKNSAIQNGISNATNPIRNK